MIKFLDTKDMSKSDNGEKLKNIFGGTESPVLGILLPSEEKRPDTTDMPEFETDQEAAQIQQGQD